MTSSPQGQGHLAALFLQWSLLLAILAAMQVPKHMSFAAASSALAAPAKLQACHYTVFCGCSEVEHQLEGTGPWQLPDGSDDIELIHVPGHTEGSLCLLYKPEKALFTGDHLNYRAALGRLNCSRWVLRCALGAE